MNVYIVTTSAVKHGERIDVRYSTAIATAFDIDQAKAMAEVDTAERWPVSDGWAAGETVARLITREEARVIAECFPDLSEDPELVM